MNNFHLQQPHIKHKNHSFELDNMIIIIIIFTLIILPNKIKMKNKLTFYIDKYLRY